MKTRLTNPMLTLHDFAIVDACHCPNIHYLLFIFFTGMKLVLMVLKARFAIDVLRVVLYIVLRNSYNFNVIS